MNGTNSVISTSGEQDARPPYGHYQVVLSLPVDGGYTINTFAATGDHRYDELSFTVADVDTANLIHRVIRDGGQQGVQPAGIVAALDDALRAELFRVQARRDLPSRNRVEHINRLLDRLESPADTEAVVVLADMVRRNLADTIPAGTHRQVRPTMAGAHLTKLSAPQQRAINSHRDGVVHVGDGVTAATLRALARKGFGVLTFEGTRKRVVSLTLNKNGLNAVKAVAR
ncbi:hypothetical protein ABT336_12115 [Micromonospora sp. NPDC000207]|uniref:hypothetical protein n=1 Tax=Micromonospora sp. NPDC000207 TaxID=3154246 RepID=UPI00332EC3DD